MLFVSRFTWYYSHYGAGIVANDAYIDLHRDYMLSGPVAVTEIGKSGGQRSAWGSLTNTISNHFKSSGSGSRKNDKSGDLKNFKLLVTNINYFATVGGFDMLVAVISNEHVGRIYDILILLKELSFKLIKKSYLESLLPRFQDIISKRLLNLEEKDYRTFFTDSKKDLVHLIWLNLEFLIRNIYKDITFFEVYEKFTLDYCEKLLSCQMLNLKIKGISMLNDLIERTSRKENDKRPIYAMSNAKVANVPSWLTTAYLFQWLQDRNLIDLLLGDSEMLKKYDMSYHDEILKRSQITLLFVAKIQLSCPEKYVKLILRSIGNVPSSAGALSTARISFSLLGHLVPYLSPESVSVIAGEIRKCQAEMSSSAVSEEFCHLCIGLLKNIVEKCPAYKSLSLNVNVNECEEKSNDGENSGDDDEMYGLDILWKFLVKNNNKNSGVENVGEKNAGGSLFTPSQLAAAETLAATLSLPKTRSQLNVFLKRCVQNIDAFPKCDPEQISPDNINEGTSVASILLIKRLIEIQSPPRPAVSTYANYTNQKRIQGQELSRALIIRSCEKNYNLMKVVVELIGKCIHGKHHNDMNSENYVIYTHALQLCMELLQVVLNNSELELTVTQVTSLWNGFVSGTVEDMDMFFNWLRDSCPGNGSTAGSYSATTGAGKGGCMTEEALRHVFLDLIGEQYDVGLLNEVGFQAIEKLFRHINGKEKTLLYPSSDLSFQVMSADLIGFDLLFKIYLSVKNSRIIEVLSKFLIALNVKLTPSLDKRSVWLAFTSKCLSCLQNLMVESSTLPPDNMNQFALRKVGRLLLLLRHFFEAIYKAIIPAAHAYTPMNKIMKDSDAVKQRPPIIPFRITVFWKKEGTGVTTNTVYVFKKGTVTVGALRTRLASDLKAKSPKLIRLTNAMRNKLNASHDSKLLESVDVTSYVDVTVLNKPEEDTENFQPTAPALILADDPESDQMAPRKMVAEDSSHLTLLFDLLSLPEAFSGGDDVSSAFHSKSLSKQEFLEISDQAWELLALLPTNPKMLHEVETLGGVIRQQTLDTTSVGEDCDSHSGNDMNESLSNDEVNWSHVLSTDGLLRQLYKLKIIHKIISPLLQTETEDLYIDQSEVHRAREWSETFINKGGAKCLKNLVLETNISEMCQGVLYKQCLSLRIELLSVLLKHRPSLLDEDDVVNMLVKKMLAFLHSAVFGQEKDSLDSSDRIESSNCERPVLKRIRSASQGSVEPPQVIRNSSVQKLERKRNRELRFQKYFSSQTKNTSAESSAVDGVDQTLNSTPMEDEDMPASFQDYDCIIVDNVMSILKVVMSEKPCTVISEILLEQTLHEWEDLLFVSMLHTPNSGLRESMSTGIIELCEGSTQATHQLMANTDDTPELPRLVHFFLANMLVLLPHSTLEGVHSAQYFNLLAKLFSFSDIFRMCNMTFDEEKSGGVEDDISLASVPSVARVTSLASALVLRTNASINVGALSRHLTDMLKNHTPVEKNEEDEDLFLQGLLLSFKSFVSALYMFSKDESSMKELKFDDIVKDLGSTKYLIHELFHNCLFSNVYVPVENEDGMLNDSKAANYSLRGPYPKCKSVLSRQCAFDLLMILIIERSNFNSLLRLLAPHHTISTVGNVSLTHGVEKSLFKYRSSISIPKSNSGYVGIQNPSCVCYLNSTLQQLFHVVSFRRGIFQVKTECEFDSPEAKDDMMLQLQYLFASLQASDKAFTDPKPFCYAFKDWDGRPTNVSVQQDASEFLAKFFQQVEGCITGSANENVLKDSFGGTFSNELLATSADGTARRSERPEPFFMLSVPVGKGNNCLSDALKSFITGEQVDFTWEYEVPCETSEETEGNAPEIVTRKEFLPTTKRTTIKSLPNHLIIHLKRFDFNLETMMQVKINDKFEFPQKLDMFPYTVAGRERDFNSESPTALANDNETSSENSELATPKEVTSGKDCMYELAGVVIHIGTAQSGHYYSLVKDRRDTSRNTWFELNDSFVSEFDIEDLEKEAFGGFEDNLQSSQVGAATAVTASKSRFRTKNAFMLVYDRVQDIDLEQSTPNLPGHISEAIEKDNLCFWHTKTIFDPIYYVFLSDSFFPGAAKILDEVSNQHATSDSIFVLKIALRIVFGTFSQARNKIHSQKWTLWLVDRMRRQPYVASLILQLISNEDYRHWLRAMLLECDEEDVRFCGKKIVSVAFAVLSSASEFSTGADISDVQDVLWPEEILNPESPPISSIVSSLRRGELACFRLTFCLMHILRDVQLQWRKMSVFFFPICVLCKNSPACRTAMQKLDFMASLLSLFLCQDTPYPELVGGNEPKNHKSRSMCEGTNSADFSSLLQAVVALLPGNDSGGNDSSEAFVDSSDGSSHKSDDEMSIEKSSEGKGRDSHDSVVNLSAKSFGMLTSSIFMYRLIKVLYMPDNKTCVLDILSFILRDSRELTETCLKIVVSAMKKEDGNGLKVPLRGALLLCKISDGLTGWRVSHVMQQIITEIKSNLQFLNASDVSLTMFLRICKYCPIAAEWFRLNYSARLTWIESYLMTRKSGMSPQKSSLWKPIKTPSSNAGVSQNQTPQVVASQMATVKLQSELNLQLIKRILATSNVKDKNRNDSDSVFLKYSRVGVLSGGYDSDDDPMDLVGVRIQVQWKNTFFPGVVASYEPKTGVHMVHYDDGDKVACILKNKVWNLLKKT